MHQRIVAGLATLLLIQVLMNAKLAWAQADTGSISGTVTDSLGAVMTKATVTAVRTETNTTISTHTNERGEYIFPTLQIGHYNISAKSEGFIGEVRQGYELNDGSAISVNFTLQVGGDQQQIIVTASVGEMVNTQTGGVEHIIDGETVRDLALNGRSYLDLLGTLPGSVVTTGGDAMATITSGTTTGVTLNGVRPTANGLYIDGTINKDIGANNTQFNNVGIDFVEHVSVQTSSFSAQWGDSAGPAINVVTKSGTNRYHGSLFENLRNNYLDATNYFSRNATTFKAIPQHLRFNDFGGSIGLPMLHDKLFFFGGAEWKVIAQNTNASTVTLPLEAYIAGNFLTTAGKCPLSNVSSLGLVINTTTCDISNLITPWGHGLQNVYKNIISKATSYSGTACTVTGCKDSGNTIFELSQPFRNREYMVRVDWMINDHSNAYGRWINDTHVRTNPLGDGSLPTTAYHEDVPANNALLSYARVLSASSSNEISFAALWNSQKQMPWGDDWEKSKYGFSYENIYSSNMTKLGIPLTSVYGYTAFDDDRFLNRSHTTYLQVKDIYSLVHGNHSIKIGALFGRNRKDQNGKPYYYGNASFTTVNNTNTSGNALADALLGNFYSYYEAKTDTYGLFRLWQASAFVDDIWRVFPRLSVNAGIRYEWTTPWTTQGNNIASFYPEYYVDANAVTVDPDSGNVIEGSGDRFNGLRRAGNGVPDAELKRVQNGRDSEVLSVPTIGKRGFYNSQRVFAPRLGFAWDIFGHGNTALRGGGGLFYDMPQGNVSYSALNCPPYLQSETVLKGNMDTLSQYSSQEKTHVLGDMYAVSAHMQRGYVYQYNLGIQQMLGKGFFAQVNYIGNQARHMLHDPDINGVDPEVEDAAFAVNANVAVNSLRKYKGFGAIYQYRTDADSNYNGLQANVNRRIGKGRFTASYTWSKALSTSSADTDVAHVYIYSKTYYYGYTTYDRRHMYNATYSLSTPGMNKRNVIMRDALGGWMLTGTARYQGGQRLTPYGTDTLGVQNRAKYYGYPVKYNHKAWNWWDVVNPGDVVNFAAPDVGTIGNCPKGIIVGPTYVDYDISARKTITFHKTMHLTINADAFNLTNHPQLSVPSVNVNSYTTHYDSSGALDYTSIGITSAGRPRNLQGGMRLTF